MAGIQPWERMAGESEQAWQAFMVYRELGVDRSLAKVGRAVGKSQALMERWSTRDGWVARAEAYDREEDRLWRISQDKARRDMSRRQVKIANVMMNRVVKALEKIDPEKLTPAELVKMFEAAAKVERMALEGPARLEITGKDGGPLALEMNLNDGERRDRLDELAKELGRRAQAIKSPEPKVIEYVDETPRLALTGAHDGGADPSGS